MVNCHKYQRRVIGALDKIKYVIYPTIRLDCFSLVVSAMNHKVWAMLHALHFMLLVIPSFKHNGVVSFHITKFL